MTTPRLIALVLVVLLLGAAGGCTPGGPGLKMIDKAKVRTEANGQVKQPDKPISLKHRWDDEFKGESGFATYEIDLDPLQGNAGAAMILRSGNQLTVQVDDQAPRTIGRSRFADAAKTSHLIELPQGAQLLRVAATLQGLRGGGLAPVFVGKVDDVETAVSRRRVLEQLLPALYAGTLLLMGGVAAGLWWRQRDALYGCFCLSALLGSVRNIDKLLVNAPLEWRVWGALLAVAYAWQLVFVVRFAVLVKGKEPHWMPLATRCVLAATTVLAVASFTLVNPGVWTAALAVLIAFGAMGLTIVMLDRPACRMPAVKFVLFAGFLLLLTGVHDFAIVRTEFLLRAAREYGLPIADADYFKSFPEPLSAHALFLFVLLMAAVVVARYNRSTAEVRALNRDLTRRVAEREGQLEQAFEALRVQREQQAVAAERQRIMRDIHDGVGSQLVGLRSLVRQSEPDVPQLVQHVDAALDELRMAVDAMQPVHGDLATVLATLRYRLQPRLTAAGVQVVWEVESLPALEQLSPDAVLQVQRILLEGFTNVIRHAQASAVHVRGRYEEAEPAGPSVVIELEDNGIGMDGGEGALGHGMANIRARAELVGAQMVVRSSPGAGTCLSLRWSLSAPDKDKPGS